MLAKNKYSQAFVDDHRANIEAQLSAYKGFFAAIGSRFT
jgi:hypothetical protein